MLPHLIVKFFKEAGELKPMKVPKALGPKNLRKVSRPPNAAGNNTTATMGRQMLTKTPSTPLQGSQ